MWLTDTQVLHKDVWLTGIVQGRVINRYCSETCELRVLYINMWLACTVQGRVINGYCRGTCCWQVLYGVTQTRARWKTCVDNMARSFMPTAVGQLYAKAYFTASAKAKVGSTTPLLTSHHFKSRDDQRYVTTYITATAEAKVGSTTSLLTSHHITSHPPLLASATSPSTTPPPPRQR